MCGIAGKLSWTKKPEESLVRKITDEMYLRGPDASGFYFDENIALGHRRLAIIDLSESGSQPMSDYSNRYKIVFNGEIYNYLDLKAELEELGAKFKSQSDTEIILEGYKFWGVDCVKKFNGMFAFALWDTHDKQLFIARDRLGKKPLLYYPLSDGGVIFASELKALLLDPEVPQKLNLNAVNQYLSLGYVLSDQVIVKSVCKLPPANCLLIKKNAPFKIWKYWELEKCFQHKKNISANDAAYELTSLLDDAVKIRMISDVPLGAFLSGGIDSSAIVAAMTTLESVEKIKTYSIGFKEKSYSELSEAKRVADLMKVSHCAEIVDCKMAEITEQLVKLADEPFADNSLIPTFYLSQFAKKEVTVALSGDGGDEMFAGYETYVADKFYQIFRHLPSSVISSLSSLASMILPTSFDKISLDFKIKKFLAGCIGNFSDAHYSWREIFSDEEKSSILSKKYKTELHTPLARNRFQYFANQLKENDYLDQAMFVDINTWLVDDILVKADRMSMASSLELRAPLLDFRIAEFAASLPSNLRLNGLNKKYILKLSQEQRLPVDIIRRKKRGFNSPIAHWLLEGLEKAFIPLLKKETIFGELIEVEQINILLQEHLARKKDNSFKLFTLLNLGIWLKQNAAINLE